jgi:hypothetical protein
VFNANSIVLTAVVAVTWVVFHELGTIVVKGLKGWRERVRG